jgi:hypothetical protein
MNLQQNKMQKTKNIQMGPNLGVKRHLLSDARMQHFNDDVYCTIRHETDELRSVHLSDASAADGCRTDILQSHARVAET